MVKKNLVYEELDRNARRLDAGVDMDTDRVKRKALSIRGSNGDNNDRQELLRGEKKKNIG